MNKINTNISVDPILKKQSTKLFNQLGLDFSTAINMFLKQAIVRNGLPFEVSLDDEYYEPNETTLAAMAEEEEMRTNPKKYKRYKSFNEFAKDMELEMENE